MQPCISAATLGAVEIDGFRQFLGASGGEQARTLFGVLAGELPLPDSVLIGTVRFTRG